MLIAQITDMHIKAAGKLAYRRVDTAEALARCVAHVNGLDPRPDIALLTGDLVDLGRPEEYALLRELLAPLEVPYYVIPGNHDHKDNLRAAFADHPYLQQDDAFLHYSIDDYPLRLIGLDSVVPGDKHGELCPQRIAWLAERLGERPEQPTLLFLHHPPFLTGIEHMDVQNLLDAAPFGVLVERHPQIVHILCGHVHRPTHTLWHGVPASIGPSPSHAVALDLRAGGPPAYVLEPPACHLHSWQPGGGLVSQISYIGTFDGPHPFFDAEGRLID